MDGNTCLEGDDVQQQVLQGTLAEITTRSDADVECCVICLDAISDPCEVVPCGHLNFDYVCALSWLLETAKCPLCKAAVTKVLHGPATRQDRPATLIEQRSSKTPTNPTSSRHVPTHSRSQRRYARRHYESRSSHDGREESARQAIFQRRNIYQRGLFSKHVGSNRLSCYQELTPHMFCSDEELISRARMWIRRELQVFSFLSLNDTNTDTRSSSGHTGTATSPLERCRANNAEFLLEYIIAILKTVDIKGSVGQAEGMLSDFLGRENTKLFLHELRAWLRSPFTKLEDWDRAVQYDMPKVNESSRRGRISTTTGSSSKGDSYRPNAPRTGEHRCRTRHKPYEYIRERDQAYRRY